MNAQILQRDLVQKSMSQMHMYNKHDKYKRPTLDLFVLKRRWAFLTQGMSEEEVADLHHTKEILENYEKIYSIVEYCSDL